MSAVTCTARPRSDRRLMCDRPAGHEGVHTHNGWRGLTVWSSDPSVPAFFSEIHDDELVSS